MDALHEAMEVQALGLAAHALLKAVHQPGLAAPHRSPQIDAPNAPGAALQGLPAGLQMFHCPGLGGVGLPARLPQGLSVRSEERRVGNEGSARWAPYKGDEKECNSEYRD